MTERPMKHMSCPWCHREIDTHLPDELKFTDVKLGSWWVGFKMRVHLDLYHPKKLLLLKIGHPPTVKEYISQNEIMCFDDYKF